jgi:serine/threonine protein phosphatase PrpC
MPAPRVPPASPRAAAERIGVFAEPEVVTKTLSAQHPFIVIASDGVFEFLSSQSVIDMVRPLRRPCARATHPALHAQGHGA